MARTEKGASNAAGDDCPVARNGFVVSIRTAGFADDVKALITAQAQSQFSKRAAIKVDKQTGVITCDTRRAGNRRGDLNAEKITADARKLVRRLLAGVAPQVVQAAAREQAATGDATKHQRKDKTPTRRRSRPYTAAATT